MIAEVPSSLLAEASVDHLPPDDLVAPTGGQCEQCMDCPIRLNIKGRALTIEYCILEPPGEAAGISWA